MPVYSYSTKGRTQYKFWRNMDVMGRRDVKLSHTEPHHYRHRIVATLDKLQFETYKPVHTHEREQRARNQPSTMIFSTLWSQTINVEDTGIWSILRQPCPISEPLVNPWINASIISTGLHGSIPASMFSSQHVTLVIFNTSSAKSDLSDVPFGVMK
ncbi:hypothetical protein BJ165DRAFT_1595990 [Panaeolus papilionaceus]|nr:hypothetical protein BJ165DRAFT_1595990 [Panaeolus papilionaceus]